MSREDEFDDFEDESGDDWIDLETATKSEDSVRVRPRRDWRDVERFREDRELKKFLSPQDWFDDLDRPLRQR